MTDVSMYRHDGFDSFPFPPGKMFAVTAAVVHPRRSPPLPLCFLAFVLGQILEPIMGKGLIPADPETWKVRRRAIVPGFHKAWLNRMMRLFAECADTLVVEAEAAARSGEVLDMEEKFCSLSLDIIGRAVFNFDFGSVSEESPVIKAVYRVLREAEHRSSSFIPYWKVCV